MCVSSESEFIMKYQEVEFVAMLLDTDFLSAYISLGRKLQPTHMEGKKS
jgi:hypothetical protein